MLLWDRFAIKPSILILCKKTFYLFFGCMCVLKCAHVCRCMHVILLRPLDCWHIWSTRVEGAEVGNWIQRAVGMMEKASRRWLQWNQLNFLPEDRECIGLEAWEQAPVCSYHTTLYVTAGSRGQAPSTSLRYLIFSREKTCSRKLCLGSCWR